MILQGREFLKMNAMFYEHFKFNSAFPEFIPLSFVHASVD